MKMPYTEALLKSIPKLENASHTKLEIIGGRPPDLVNPPKGCRFAPALPVRAGAVPGGGAAAGRGRDRRATSTPAGTRSARPSTTRPSSAAGPRAELTRGERGQLMAGSGDAHLRPDGEALLSVEDLVVEFPVGRTGLQVNAVSGIILRRAARRDPRPRRRVGLRQVDHRSGHHAAAPADGRQRRVRRPGAHHARRARPCACCAPNVQMIFQDPISSLNPRRKVSDIVEEPLEIWERGHQGRPRRTRSAQVLEEVGHRPGGGRRPAAAPVLRRSVPAHLHRPGPGARPEDAHLRRAGLGARRERPGPGAQPARGAEGSASA